jgi:hypothetical protein
VQHEPVELPEHLGVEHIGPVVAAAAPRVRQQCWQPALDTRSRDVPTTASVIAHAEIGPEGDVTDVKVEDAPASYPELSGCIAQVVGCMRFPHASKSTRVNIPFVFDAR